MVRSIMRMAAASVAMLSLATVYAAPMSTDVKTSAKATGGRYEIQMQMRVKAKANMMMRTRSSSSAKSVSERKVSRKLLERTAKLMKRNSGKNRVQYKNTYINRKSSSSSSSSSMSSASSTAQ
jgi:hypothetical protein